MTTVIPTKIEKCCSTILVRFCFLYFFSGGCFGKIINMSCGPSGALTSAAKVPCPSRKTLYCKPDSKVITPAIQEIASLVFYVSLRKYKMQKTIRSFIYIYMCVYRYIQPIVPDLIVFIYTYSIEISRCPFLSIQNVAQLSSTCFAQLDDSRMVTGVIVDAWSLGIFFQKLLAHLRHEN